MTEEEIAQRAAAERRDATEKAGAEPVHAAPARGKRRRYSLRRDRDEGKEMQHAVAWWQAPHR
jgi:hypothetical protein